MKAAVLYSTVPNADTSAGAAARKPSYKEARPLVVQELERPEPRAGELGVAITYSSLCHSDLSVVDGSRVRPLPMALGHEAVGRVVSVWGRRLRCNGRRACGAGVRAQLRGLPCLPVRPSCSVPPGGRGQRLGRSAARRGAAADAGGGADQPSPGRLGFCRIRGGGPGVGGGDRRRRPGHCRGDVRLRRAHRHGSGAQHRSRHGRAIGGRLRARGGGPFRRHGRVPGRRRQRDRHRSQSGQAPASPATAAPPLWVRPGTPPA